MSNNTDKLQRIQCVITDCDGILSDGRIYITENGERIKTFHVHDGAAFKMLQNAGYLVALISGRDSPPLRERARELDVEAFYPGSADKSIPFQKIMKNHQLEPEEICYIGDDLSDLNPFKRAGFSATVPDAAEEIRTHADYITNTRGGNGAFREIAERILKIQNHWEEVVEGYE